MLGTEKWGSEGTGELGGLRNTPISSQQWQLWAWHISQVTIIRVTLTSNTAHLRSCPGKDMGDTARGEPRLALTPCFLIVSQIHPTRHQKPVTAVPKAVKKQGRALRL